MAEQKKRPSFDEIAYGGRRSTGWSSGRTWNKDSYGGYGNYGGYGGGYGFQYALNIKASDFEKGTITAAKTLSNDTDVEVIFGGDEIKANKNLIQLPAIDSFKGISPTDAKIVRGYTDHEIVRRRISDIDQDEKMRAAKNGAHKVFSCIEDVRTAKAGRELYSGTGDNIEAAINVLADKMYQQMLINPKIAQDIEAIGPYAVAMEGRKQAGYDITKHDRIMDMLHPLDRSLIEEIASQAVALDAGVGTFGDIDKTRARDGFRATVRLAEEANRMFAMRAAEKKEEEEKDGNGGGGAGGDPGDAGDGKAGVGKDEEGSPELMLDMRQAIAGVFDGPRKIGDPKNYLPGIREMDTFLQPDDIIKNIALGSSTTQIITRDNGLKRANVTLRQTSSSLAVMKTNLERLLMSKNQESREEKRGGGKLNHNKLVQAYNQDENVFTKRAEDVAINTAVQLVVDLSGSMSGSKLALALQATILMSEALTKCDVPFEIVGFRTTGYSHAIRGVTAKVRKTIEDLHTSGKTNRHDSIEMNYFKPFSQRYQMCLPAIGNMHAGGANCDGESILYAGESLLKRPERKKVMIVLSDGEPAFGYINVEESAVHAYVKKAAEQLTNQGIFVLGIGIQSRAVETYYKNNIVINNIAELPKAVLQQLAAAIL